MKRQTGSGINEQLEVTGSGGGGGDATAANQVLEIAALNSIDAKVSTAAKQDTGNGILALIELSTANLDVALSTRASEATLALIKAKTDNIDVALSTRTKPADQQHVIVDSGSVTTGGLTDTQLRATPVPVSGSVTANAGTNLNTSLLALEAGGNLAAIAASASVLDDWDESDRAKVNLIAGQAGITAGAGAVAANTPRTTLASDDPAVAVLGTTSGAAITTDVDGTIQRYLRGLVKMAGTAGSFLVTAALSAGSNLIGYVGKKFTYGGVTTLTTTNFSGLTSGSGWQSASIATGGAGEIQFNLTTLGAAGSTALVDFYLAEAFTSGNFTDAATGTEGTFTASGRKNSRYIGSLQLNGTTSVTGCIKYTDVSGSITERVALIGINNSGGTISATGGNTVFNYELIN